MIVGFGFNKINAEKLEGKSGKISINNNVDIKDIEETSISLGKQKQNALRFIFEFTSKYEPSVGDIVLGGDLLYVDDSKVIKDTISLWKDGKKINKDVMGVILNAVLTKCNVQALITSQQINLPPPIPLPKVNVVQPEDKSSKERGKDSGYIG